MPLPRPLVLESSLLRAAGFRHGFSARPLDFRPDRPDLAEHEESLALLLRMRADRMYRVSQVHGAEVAVASGDPGAVAAQRADALLALSGDAAVMVRVADCVPILLADSRSGAVAAVHAGWRGVVAGVVARAVERGAELGARFDLAAVGPCIGACCFEVDRDVAERIARSCPAASAPLVVVSSLPKPKVDLRAAVRSQLLAAGLLGAQVDDVAGCTRCDAELFFSHRRDGDASGRQVGAIASRG